MGQEPFLGSLRPAPLEIRGEAAGNAASPHKHPNTASDPKGGCHGEAFTGRLTNLRQDIAGRQDTSGDKFSIELDGQVLDNRGIAGELIVRRAEKIKNRFGDDVRIGRFAGFDLFLRPTFNNNVEMILRGKNSYAARVTDTAQGTIRSLEANVQGFEERASKLEYDITDATKRAKELESKVGAHFEREERYQQLTRRQSEIEEKLDLTKNQAPSQVEADSTDVNEQKNTETQTKTHSPRPKRRTAEDEAAFHKFRLSVRSYETELGVGCISYTKRAANPVVASDCRVLPE